MRVRLSMALSVAMALAPAAHSQGVHGQSADAQAASFLKGYWLSCAGGEEVSETWSDARGGVMVGTSLTLSHGKASWELLRIGPSGPAQGKGISYFAQPSGQAPAEFVLAPAGSAANRLVFENLAHDFPQRVIYSLKDKTLTARIEGEIGGKPKAMEWAYKAASLNQRCPS